MRSPMKAWQIAVASAGAAGPGRVPHRSGHHHPGTAKLPVWNARTSVSGAMIEDMQNEARDNGSGLRRRRRPTAPISRRNTSRAPRGARGRGERAVDRSAKVELPSQSTNKEPECSSSRPAQKPTRRASAAAAKPRDRCPRRRAGRSRDRSRRPVFPAPAGCLGRASGVAFGPRSSVGRQPAGGLVGHRPRAFRRRCRRGRSGRRRAVVGRCLARLSRPHGGGAGRHERGGLRSGPVRRGGDGGAGGSLGLHRCRDRRALPADRPATARST